jgi:arylsulfatase A-like enzyme
MSLSRREWIGAAAAPLLAQAGKRRPNVVLIMTDDQGYGDIGVHGNTLVKTPHLDRFSERGIELTRFYVSPVCAPTRASLLTGRYNLRTGVHGVTRGRETMRADEVTLAEALRPAGYKTALVGKWHLGEHYPYVPHAQGFDEFTGFRTGHWNRYFDAPLERNGRPFQSKGFITDFLTDEAIAFMERNRRDPFFLYLAYNAPHSPFQAPDENVKRFEGMDLDEKTKVVYAMVENIDTNFGRLLGAIDRLKLTEDTIVIFMTDNGPAGERYNANLRGRKATVFEGGVRVPFFLRWPARFKAPKKIDTLAGHIDLYPTLLELCGVTALQGKPIDGRSIVPVLEGKTENWPDRMFFTHSDRELSAPFPGAVRTQRYNLVNGTDLYEVGSDATEEKNIAAEHPDVVKRLQAAYDAWFAEVSRECRFERLPIQVGHAEENPVALPATQAYFDGHIAYRHKNGYAHDWLAGWTNEKDSVWWEIDVVRDGQYDVGLRYASLEPGSEIEVDIAGRKAKATIRQRVSPAPLPDRNLVKDDHYVEVAWGTLPLGRLDLPRGRTRLTVRAVSKAGETVMELKEAVLRRV